MILVYLYYILKKNSEEECLYLLIVLVMLILYLVFRIRINIIHEEDLHLIFYIKYDLLGIDILVFLISILTVYK